MGSVTGERRRPQKRKNMMQIKHSILLLSYVSWGEIPYRQEPILDFQMSEPIGPVKASDYPISERGQRI